MIFIGPTKRTWPTVPGPMFLFSSNPARKTQKRGKKSGKKFGGVKTTRRGGRAHPAKANRLSTYLPRSVPRSLLGSHHPKVWNLSSSPPSLNPLTRLKKPNKEAAGKSPPARQAVVHELPSSLDEGGGRSTLLCAREHSGSKAEWDAGTTERFAPTALRCRSVRPLQERGPIGPVIELAELILPGRCPSP